MGCVVILIRYGMFVKV